LPVPAVPKSVPFVPKKRAVRAGRAANPGDSIAGAGDAIPLQLGVNPAPPIALAPTGMGGPDLHRHARLALFRGLSGRLRQA